MARPDGRGEWTKRVPSTIELAGRVRDGLPFGWLGRDSDARTDNWADHHRLGDRGSTMTVAELLSIAESMTVAGPVVLWPVLLVFVGGLLVGAVWSLLRGWRRGS